VRERRKKRRIVNMGNWRSRIAAEKVNSKSREDRRKKWYRIEFEK
jgi:hypothetical protein